MNEFESTAGQTWQLFSWLGIEHPFFSIDHAQATIIINTWIIVGIIFAICFPVRWFLKKQSGTMRYLILSFAHTFIDLCKQAMGTLIFPHFAFVTSIFLFIFFCNIASIIPFMEEPTSNINTTLALAICSFFYVQFNGIRAHGIKGYLKEYTEPFIVMAPLHIISKLASIVSMSCRLFGNIFGGAIIMTMYIGLIKKHILFEALGLGLGLNFIFVFFFSLFEGFLQAFVFTMLSLTYLSIAIAHEEQNHGAST